jgi:hypothetical protein
VQWQHLANAAVDQPVSQQYWTLTWKISGFFPRSHLGANSLNADESLRHSHGLDLVDGIIRDPWFGHHRIGVISASHHSYNHLFIESSKIIYSCK